MINEAVGLMPLYPPTPTYSRRHRRHLVVRHCQSPIWVKEQRCQQTRWIKLTCARLRRAHSAIQDENNNVSLCDLAPNTFNNLQTSRFPCIGKNNHSADPIETETYYEARRKLVRLSLLQ